MAKPKQKILIEKGLLVELKQTKYRYITVLHIAAEELYNCHTFVTNQTIVPKDKWVQLKKLEWLEKAEGLLK